MLQKKICMLGSFAVGKTSLVRRFVESIFSDEYHTTVGVKISNKIVHAAGTEVTLVLWDLYGDDEFQQIRWSHFGGASGYLLVADGTRRATLDKAIELEGKVRDKLGAIPFVLVINKSDLSAEWEIDSEAEAQLAAKGWNILHTSAKCGDCVDEAFEMLTNKMVSS